MHDNPPRILARQNASQFTRTPGPVLRKSFVRELVKLAGTCVTLDRRIELRSFELFEPSAKTRKFSGGELFHGSFNFFGSRHASNISLPQPFRKDAASAIGAFADPALSCS